MNSKKWHDEKQNNLLWIKGEPGKGKTMLLCGILEELKASMAPTAQLTYFFCQATDARINNATAALQGLLYPLVDRKPALVSYMRETHHVRSTLSEDKNAWDILYNIAKDILQGPSSGEIYVIVDALDECVADLNLLLDLIELEPSKSPRVKWIVSSRPADAIRHKLRPDESGPALCIDLKDNADKVANIVDTYIDDCVQRLAAANSYGEALQKEARRKLQEKANGTFLWVSLVVKELSDVKKWNVLHVIDEQPPGLVDLYRRMMQQIEERKHGDSERCKAVLSTVSAAYQPLFLEEIGLLSGLSGEIAAEKESVVELVDMCGSFLTIQEESVYIVHQSANDFLRNQGLKTIFPKGTNDVHYRIFSASTQMLLKTLKRDIYNLKAIGTFINNIKLPEPDPLAAARYSCVYWVDHLCDSGNALRHEDFRNDSNIDKVMREKFLHWLEALSLCRSVSKGVTSMAKLETLCQVNHGSAFVNSMC